MKTILPTNFKEAPKKDGRHPGVDTRHITATRAGRAATTPIFSPSGVEEGHSDAAARLVPAVHSALEEKAAASSGAVI